MDAFGKRALHNLAAVGLVCLELHVRVDVVVFWFHKLFIFRYEHKDNISFLLI